MKKYLIILTYIAIALNLNSQKRLKVDTSQTIENLVKYLVNSESIVVNNIKIRGLSSSIGKFELDSNAIGIQKGVVLSTGNINDIVNGNKTPGTSGLAWDNAYRFKSDRDLNKLSNGVVADQIVLEFDFVSFENHLSFNYIFASEEYKEYVGSRFNDVFGFVVTGDNNFRQNIALVPHTIKPVTVNNINHLINKDLFVNNNCFDNYNLKKEIDETEPRTPFVKSLFALLFGSKNKDFVINQEERKLLSNYLFDNFEFDGLTKPLVAECFLIPYKVYHMKIAIGDVGDPMFDSGVFIEKGSFKSVKNKNQPKFEEYADLRNTINLDSLFHQKIVTPIKIDSPPQIEEEFEITNINFDSNKFRVPDTSQVKIRALAFYLSKNPSYKVHLIGYTDNIGGLEYNQKLSEKRAKSVKKILAAYGVAEDKVNFIGNNFENPLMDNSKAEGRYANRRVEILVLE